MRLNRQIHKTVSTERRTISVLAVCMFIGLMGVFALVDAAVPAAAVDFQGVADFVRAGDPGEGYDPCDPIPNWLDVNNLPPGATKWGEYIFVFEHLDGTTQTVCGTSSDVTIDNSGNTIQWGMDTFVAGTGGTTHPGPGMMMHVSCSQNFIAQDGWDEGKKSNGPIQGVDTDWHIIRYIGARYQVSEGEDGRPPAGELYIKNACGQEFTLVTSEPPTTTTAAPTTTTTVAPTTTTTVAPPPTTTVAPPPTTTVATQVLATQVQEKQQLAVTGNGSLVLLAAVGSMFLGLGGLAASASRPRRWSGR